MIRVVAIITANPGRRDELLAAFRANVPNVHAEKGCIEYAGHIDAATVGPFQADYGPDSLVVLESWESPEALRAHVAAPHMKTYSEKTKDLVAKPDNSHPVRDRLGPSHLGSGRPRLGGALGSVAARDATRGLNTEIWIAASADYCCLVKNKRGAARV